MGRAAPVQPDQAAAAAKPEVQAKQEEQADAPSLTAHAGSGSMPQQPGTHAVRTWSTQPLRCWEQR